jgi:hypothetical protein
MLQRRLLPVGRLRVGVEAVERLSGPLERVTWLQAASQEPDASFWSRGGASTAMILGFPLMQWVAKPQERYPGLCTLTDSAGVNSVAFSPNGKRVVSGSADNLVKIWNAETGAEVRSFVGVRWGWRGDAGLLREFLAFLA